MIQVKSLRVTAFDGKDNLIGCGRQYDWKRNGTDGETEHRIVDYTEDVTRVKAKEPLLAFTFGWRDACCGISYKKKTSPSCLNKAETGRLPKRWVDLI